ncbi:hypothetical protein Geob_2549 [Geotalea daltonii FRC-32]|uniref:Magnetosome protein MamS/MamX domain-containing protein n=1 Tax=Geotalea daltonii (strain DSM 22248 / JCM 15807 / FRC-32) TaxID=316067 RepID=B9M0P7_GEODF|nr:hypothetical protein [Geotalea daltonii]ACM20900.1 hypothetical protein Geob_2549 [Geotalea daltonii FRC-32]
MKRTRFVGIITGIIMITTSLAVAAGMGGGGWGIGGAYQRIYNPSTVETVSGTIERVDRMKPMRGMGAGIHLLLKTDKETIPVHLGPDWYINKLDAKLEKGEKLDVTGSKVTISGKPVIIASELKKGDEVLVLRDAAGVPAWSGWRRK